MALKINRLARLADLLESYQGDGPRFDLEGWTQSEIKRAGFLWQRFDVKCHTTACAVGLACLTGIFRDDGLSHSIDGRGLSPVYAGLKDYDAVEAFFGLTDTQSENLFDVGHYDGPTQGIEGARAVASRIRKLIGKKLAKRSKRTTPAVERMKREALELAKAE